VRTGAGKSQTTRKIQTMLREAGKKVVSIRHPMPYGDLVKQRVQRFATVEDLAKNECTIEEMEEYDAHVVAGNVIYAGVDYESDRARGRKRGRRDPLGRRQQRLQLLPGRPLHHGRRPAPAGQRSRLLPGEVNLRLADVVVMNKIDSADRAGIEAELDAVRSVNRPPRSSWPPRR